MRDLASGETRNDLTYAVSLAKTWNDPDMPVFGNFTTFVELYNTTDLDGITLVILTSI